MNSDRDIFLNAPEFASAEELDAYLSGACGGDADLRRRVEAMMAAAGTMKGFMKTQEQDWPTRPDEAPSGECLGSMIGHYKLLQEIGEGGFGVVYMAQQLEPVMRRVALKVIKPGMDSKQVIGRFEAERQALALMDHPHIARVFDAGATESGRPYFVMELINGIPITTFCQEQNLDIEARLHLFIDVCAAVQHAHQKGIIHRDLKPTNVLVTLYGDRPVPKVIDFGIAKATAQPLTEKTVFTQFQQFMGTPAYTSPEQAALSGLDVDTRSDIYSLGVLLYELLAGSPPFDTKELMSGGLDEMRRIIREQEPERPSTKLSRARETHGAGDASRAAPGPRRRMIPSDLDWIVMKALEKDRNRRYETANGLAMDVQRNLDNEPVVAAAPSTAYRMAKFARRHKAALGVTTMVTALLLVGIAVSMVLAFAAKQAESVAREALSRSYFQEAQHLLEKGDASRALAYLAKALREEPGNQSVALRIMNLLMERNFALPSPMRAKDRSFVERTYWEIDEDSQDQGTLNFRAIAPRLDRPMGEAHFATRNAAGDRIAVANATGRNRGGIYDMQLFSLPGGTFLGSGTFRTGFGFLRAFFQPGGNQLWVAVQSPGLVQRMNLRTFDHQVSFVQHESQVLDFAFRTDGRLAHSLSRDGSIKQWDMVEGAESMEPITGIYQEEDGRTTSRLEVSENGAYIHVVGDGALWDVRDGRALQRKIYHGVPVHDLDFSPDSTSLAAACADGTVRLMDPASGQVTSTIKAHEQTVHTVSFSSDGRRLLTASADGWARIWNAGTGFLLREFFHPGRDVQDARWSPGEELVATGAIDPQTAAQSYARIWDPRSGEAVTDPLPIYARDLGVRFSYDARLLAASGFQSGGAVWDVHTGKSVLGSMLNPEAPGSVWFLDFVPGTHRRFGTTSLRHGLWVSNEDFTEFKTMVHHGHGIHAAAVSPDGTSVATGAQDDTAIIVSLETGEALTEPLAHDSTVTSLAFSPGGQALATGGWGRKVRIWDTRYGMPLVDPIALSDAVTDITFSENGRYLAASGGAGQVIIRDWLETPELSPPWLADLAELVAGMRVGSNGMTEPRIQDRYETFTAIRNTVENLHDKSTVGRWAKWFFSERTNRYSSPWSKIPAGEHYQQRIAGGEYEELIRATTALPNQAEGLWKLGLHLQAEGREGGEYFKDRARFFDPDIEAVQLSTAALGPKDSKDDIGMLRGRLGRSNTIQGKVVRVGSSLAKDWLYLNFTEGSYSEQLVIKAWLGDPVDGIDREFFDSLNGKTIRVRGPVNQHLGNMCLRVYRRDDIRVLDQHGLVED